MQAVISVPNETRDLEKQNFPVQEVSSDAKMKATVFHGKDDIRVEEVEKPRAGSCATKPWAAGSPTTARLAWWRLSP